MDRLTEKKDWERNYLVAPGGLEVAQEFHGEARNFRQQCKAFLGENLKDYSNYLLWKVVLGSLLPKNPNLKALEIGSAPGQHLLLLREAFGYAPYGVEYTEAGAQLNRQLFEKNGIDPAQVILADAFSPEFLNQYRESFDVVTSFGFVEHFEDVRTVIERHLDLLKVDGWLVVQIPRIAGLNYYIARLLNRESLPMHNLQVMQKDVFEKVFEGLPLDVRFCNYVGTMKLILCLPHNRSGWLGQLTNAIKNLQLGCNLFLHWLFKQKGPETNFLSPYLVFVGRKLASPPTASSLVESYVAPR